MLQQIKNYQIIRCGCGFLWLLFLPYTVCAQQVTNVDFYHSGKRIVVADALDRTADISVMCSEDGGRTFGPALQKVSDGVGMGVTAGNKRLTRDVTAERERSAGERIVFRVAAEAPLFCEMVFVEGGIFTMGTSSEQDDDAEVYEKPAHQVTVSSFYIGKYEVTQAQWVAIMDSNPSSFKGGDRPVENVSWDDIQEFLRKLNAQAGGRYRYRLPTEAEWEYAARGGNQSRGYKYSGSNDPDRVAWYEDNSGSQTHPVGRKSPNELGIYDMPGNVWEWCQDWYEAYPSAAQTDPADFSRSFRVLRGGSWGDRAWRCRVSLRSFSTPDYRSGYGGFRLAAF